MKIIKSKQKIYRKDGDEKDLKYVQERLDEFVWTHKEFWTWKEFSNYFGQNAVGTIRNWYLDGIPKNQIYFVHLVLERIKY